MTEDPKDKVPQRDELFEPTLQALRDLGGSGSNDEIVERVEQILDIPEEVAEVSHLGSKTQTELEYRVAWAKTLLKKSGLVDNTQRGVWALTPEGRETDDVDPKEVRRRAKEADEEEPGEGEAVVERTHDLYLPDEHAWKDELLDQLKKLDPDAFERLSRLVLRESGVEDVQVTGKAGDGGIDGTGTLQLEGMLTFPVVFQCKRYDGTVGPDKVRDLRGAMMGRADRGLLITTGRFTRGAREEAQRDGATPIDLVNGEEFAEMLADLELGIESVEAYRLDEDWFEDV